VTVLSRRVLAIAAVLIGVLWLAPAPAYAWTTDYSVWWYYGPVAGVSYANQSLISNNTVMTGSITVRPTNGTIPGGWSGAQATLYHDGAVCLSASMYYNSDLSTQGWTGGIAVRYCGGGNYTTRGSTAAYNGTGYNYYYTATSPIFQHS
jgi:hypothetical protein